MASKKLETLTVDELAARMSKLLKKLDKLKVKYANEYDPRYGHTMDGANCVSELNLCLTTGERLNEQYRLLTGEYYDHRFMAPKLYKELTSSGIGYHAK